MNIERIIPPSMRFKAISLSEYRKVYNDSVNRLEEFWSREAENLTWKKKWSHHRTGEGPYTRWFTGGTLSPYENIIARHNNTSLWRKTALIYLDENGEAEAITFSRLDQTVKKLHCSLRGLGLKQGDWVAVYSPPTIPSFAFMLAAIRAGLPFEPIFTGFSPPEMYRRVKTRKAKALFVTAEYSRRGKTINVLSSAQEFLDKLSGSGVSVIIDGATRDGKYIDYSNFLAEGCSVDEAVVESTSPLFGLHSGYEEDFRPITHPAAGFLVQAYSTSRWIGLRPRDTLFCTVWPGWITGVTYQLFGPLMLGSTILLYSGGPDWPRWSRWLDIIDSYAVTVFLTTGAAIRILSKQDPSIFKGKNDTLREIIITAEPLEPVYWHWAYETLGMLPYPIIDSSPAKGGSIPVVNMFIQSEIGTFITGNLVNYTFTHIEPGSVGPPIPGFALDIVDEHGNTVRGKPGRLVVKSPWPSMPLDAPREFYLSWTGGFYDTGDLAIMNDEGYIYPLGRRDSVLKVSGYRLSPGALEKSLDNLQSDSWALVLPLRNPEKFETPVVLYQGVSDENEIIKRIREEIGPIAAPERVVRLSEKPPIPPSSLRRELSEMLRHSSIEDVIARLQTMGKRNT